MGRLEACRICLITDVKMERIQGSLETNIKSVFGHNILYSSDLPDYSCYECSALITKFSKFRKKYFTAQGLLFNILQNHGVVTEKEIKNIDRVANKLNSNMSATPINSDQQVVEIKIECDPMEDVLEMTSGDVEGETDSSGSEDDTPLQSVKQIEHINVNTLNKKQHTSKRKNHMNTENYSGESSNKMRKLQGNKARNEKLLQDFDVAKLTMEFRLRASPMQFSLMIEFMESHGDLSRPQAGLQGRVKNERLWQELTEVLNSVAGSGVHKTADKWKRVWSDWKTKTKKKASIINQDKQGTGGWPSRGKPLSRLEKRVLRIIGITAVTGNEEIQKAGFQELSHPQVSIAERVPSPVDEIELLVIPPAPEDTPMSVPADVRTTTPPACPLTPTPGPSNINKTIQEERSPVSGLSTPRRHRIRRRRLRQTPCERATSAFVAIEENRLRLERKRDARLFQIESERLKTEAQRVQLDRERLQVEAERARAEQGRERSLADLRASTQQLHLQITALMSLLHNRDTRPN